MRRMPLPPRKSPIGAYFDPSCLAIEAESKKLPYRQSKAVPQVMDESYEQLRDLIQQARKSRKNIQNSWVGVHGPVN